MDNKISNKEAEFFVKKKMFSAIEKQKEDVQLEIQEFIKIQSEIDTSKSVFIDEAGCNQDMTRLYARSEKGERAYSFKPSSRGKRTTIISGLGLNGMVGTLIF